MKERGFTLIELSIVLVIIGLLVGGILVGRDLIDAANVRKDFATIEKYGAAVNTFKLKYNALPGDITNPSQFGFNANSYGDGNGKIQALVTGDDLYRSATVGSVRSEWFYVTHHLGKAGLIDLSGEYDTSNNVRPQVAGTHYPKMFSNPGAATTDNTLGYPPGIILSYEQNNRVNGHFFRMGAVPWYPNNHFTSFHGGFVPIKAKLIDQKFDDGKPVSGGITIGSIQSQCADDVYDTSNPNCQIGGLDAPNSWNSCAVLATLAYDVVNTRRNCSLRVKASF